MSSIDPLNTKTVPNASTLSTVMAAGTKQNEEIKVQAILMCRD